ncbi:MAG: NAD(+) diphosphatase [Stomatobaculum sp.]
MIQDIFPKQYHVDYFPDRKPSADSVLMVCGRDEILVKKEGEAERLPHFSDLIAADVDFSRLSAQARYLFAIDQDWHFLVPRSALPGGLLSAGYRFLTIAELRDFSPKHEAFAAVTATQFWRFYDTRKFCGRCGAPTVHAETERAMLCKHCGLIEYPKICPAAIVAVTDGDRILLTRYARNASDYRRKALIAGFVEVGETPEDTVRREVFEETGLRVKNIRPYRIQPWSFSDSLMLGYTAELDGSDKITLQEAELCEAAFYRREEVPENPNMTSVANEMMQAFRRGEL